MGVVRVEVAGSFVGQFGIQGVTETFSAIDNGHADAVGRAIEYLAKVVLPRATALDHDLHRQDVHPAKGWTPVRITR